MLRTATSLALRQANKPLAGASYQVARTMASAAKNDVHTFELSDKAFKGYRIDTPSTTVKISKADAVKLYKDMCMVRRLEMAADAAYKHNLIRGFCHLGIGQEATTVGMDSALSPIDAIVTSYRCHGYVYMRGADPVDIIAEMMGRRTGVSKGKGGSMHMYLDNFYGGNGIVGAQVPIGAGLAFGQKYKGEKAVSLALYGDGAANQGQIFETFNMAQLWKLPVLFVCENNGYAMGTPAAKGAADTDYYTRGEFVPGIKCDGMDVLAVRQVTQYCRDYMLKGNGPIVLELKTYRYGGHSMSDPGTAYRSREEVQRMRDQSDPIAQMKKRLISAGISTEEELKSIDKTAKNVIMAAMTKAKAIPEPNVKELWTDIYVAGSEPSHLRGRVPEETHYFNVD